MNGGGGGGGASGAGFSGANFNHNVDPHEIFNMFFGSNDFGFGGGMGSGGMGGGFPGGFQSSTSFGGAGGHPFMNGHGNPFGQSQRSR